MMFGQQPYVYQQPIYNQPIGQPISQPMQEPMMRPQYQPATQMPVYQPQPQQPQNQSIIWIPNEQAASDFIVAPNNAVTLLGYERAGRVRQKGRRKRKADHDDLRPCGAHTGPL